MRQKVLTTIYFCRKDGSPSTVMAFVIVVGLLTANLSYKVIQDFGITRILPSKHHLQRVCQVQTLNRTSCCGCVHRLQVTTLPVVRLPNSEAISTNLRVYRTRNWSSSRYYSYRNGFSAPFLPPPWYYLVQSHFVSPTTIPTLPVGHGVCPGNCNGQCHPTCKGRQPHRFSALGAIVRRRRRFLSPRIFWVMRYPARREYRCSYQHLTDILVYLVEDVPSPVPYSTGWSVYPVILVGETKPHNSGATKRQSHSAAVGRKGRR